MWGDWGLESSQFVVSFELNGRPYLFETKGRSARIARIDFNSSEIPWVVNDKGEIFRRQGGTWKLLPGKARDIGVGADGTAWVIGTDKKAGGYGIHRWDGKAWHKIDGGAIRIDVDPSNTQRVMGWTFVYQKSLSEIATNCTGRDNTGHTQSGITVERIYSGNWGKDFFVSRSFELSGHPHIFSLKSMQGEQRLDVFETLPGEGYLTRINDDGRGWKNLVNLPHIQIIIDRTLRDKVPAVMMGDFNIHLDHYGNMNRMFETFGATDAYVAVHGDNMQGAETIDACNNPLTQVFGQKVKFFDTLNPLNIEKVTLGKKCFPRFPPEYKPPKEKESMDLCAEPYKRGKVTSITPFELNGQPHIFVLTTAENKWNMADIYRISGEASD